MFYVHQSCMDTHIAFLVTGAEKKLVKLACLFAILSALTMCYLVHHVHAHKTLHHNTMYLECQWGVAAPLPPQVLCHCSCCGYGK